MFHRSLTGPNALRVSGEPERRNDVHRMGEWLDAELHKVGVVTKKIDLGRQSVDGHDLALPPAIVGRLGDDPAKKTVLIYGHYDVQPVRSGDCESRSGLR
jgi:Cys-Gly metallodipeptidase DUG1